MSDPDHVHHASRAAVHELIEETKRLLADRGNDRLEAFTVTAHTYATALARYAERRGERGLAASCAYSGRVVAALLLEVIELEAISQGLAASAEAAAAGPDSVS